MERTVRKPVTIDNVPRRLHPVIYKQEAVVPVDAKLAGRELTADRVNS